MNIKDLDLVAFWGKIAYVPAFTVVVVKVVLSLFIFPVYVKQYFCSYSLSKIV